MSKLALRKLVRVFDPAEVTTRGEHELPARDGGLAQADVEAIWDTAVELYRTRLQPAIAMCVQRRGKIVLDRAIGHVSGNAPGDPPGGPLVRATPDSLYNLFSASKVVTAMLVHLLDDQGLLHLDDAVDEYIPEFGRHGKHHVTLRHILTHRAGMARTPGESVDLDLLSQPDRIVQLLCDSEPTHRSGRRLAYHAVTGGFILAEVIRRVSGRDIQTLLDETLRQPLGFENFRFGVPPQDVPRVAQHALTGLPPLPPMNYLLRRSLGAEAVDAVRFSNDPRFLTGVIPSGNLIATPREVVRYFELLLRFGELDGQRIFAHRTVRRAVAEQSWLELDAIFLLPVRYGMGFMLGGERFSLYGKGTPEAFGHLGFTHVLAWADPERDLSVAFFTTGKSPTDGLGKWLDVTGTIARRVPRTPVPVPA